MTAMRARMAQSSRLHWGRMIGATTSRGWVVATSAMEGASRIDADALLRHPAGHDAVLRDPEPANRVHRDVGAQPGLLHRLADEVRPEQRAEEHERVHAGVEHVLPALTGALDQDVFRPNGERDLRARRETVRLAGQVDLTDADGGSTDDRAGDEVHHADEVRDEWRRRLSIDRERRSDLLDRAAV